MIDSKNNAIENTNYQDFLDRLICNGFIFDIDLKERKMYIPTYQWRETTWSDVGFHYYGNREVHYISIRDENELSDIISDAVGCMKEYMKDEVSNKLKDVIIHHLGRKC